MPILKVAYAKACRVRRFDVALLALALAGPAAAAPVAKDVVYSFAGPDGAHPFGQLVADASGALYGLGAGGANKTGAIFRVVPPAEPGGAATETVLYSFPAGTENGLVQLAIGTDGTLYGSIESADTIDNGRIFALSPPAIGSTAWSYSEIYRFTGGADANPNFITVGPDGALYGGTNALLGEIYRLAPGANGWTEQILYTPANTSPLTGPAGFASPLTFAPDGSIYGASNYGPSSNANEGTIFHLTPPSAGNAAYSATVIFIGNAPGALALQLPNAIFAQSVGTKPSRLLLLTPPATGTLWNPTQLALFEGLTGNLMNFGLSENYNHAGAYYNLLATMQGGGGRGAHGLVVQLAVTQNGVLQEVFPHIFYATTGDGQVPSSGLTKLVTRSPPRTYYYGVTQYGGAHGMGTVYRIE